MKKKYNRSLVRYLAYDYMYKPLYPVFDKYEGCYIYNIMGFKVIRLLVRLYYKYRYFFGGQIKKFPRLYELIKRIKADAV